MASGAVDRAVLRRRRLNLLHLRQLLIDHAMHELHLARRAFGPLLVLCVVAVDVTVCAAHAERSRVAAVHDGEKGAGPNVREVIHILEYLARR